MQKLIKFFKKSLFLLVALLVVTPSFYRMLRPGLFSTQDFHLFRLIEYDKCIKDFQFPCRWAADAGFGYGEPIFNFYGQLSYLFGEIFHLSGFSLISSFKLLFVLSLIGSFVSMFFLAKRIWRNSFSALISGALYVYAPYRALDVWVRGALPEAFSFVFFPLIILFLDKFFDKENKKDGIVFSLFIAALILTHNLSFILFLPVLIAWIILKISESKKVYLIKQLFFYFLLAFLISSFYILPVLFEARYVTLATTTQGYFDFRGHFATLSQLLFSRFWGYGASLFGPEEFMSRAVGHVQWILPLMILFLIRKKLKQNRVFLLLLLTGWFLLFMTHNKSTYIWEIVKPLAYIQFPWRFLAPAIFSFALSSGALVGLLKKRKLVVTLTVIALAIVLNLSFFREDNWYQRGDEDVLKGEVWEEQISTSLKDYWPKFGKFYPTKPAPLTFGGQVLIKKESNYASYLSSADYSKAVRFPISYFPGWTAKIDGKEVTAYPSGNLGLVTVDMIESGTHNIELNFSNTSVRTVGNFISLASLIFVIYTLLRQKNTRNKTLVFLFLIVILGSFLRLYRLSEYPPSLNWDEVSHGYNAYSILKTGADEWGKKLPLLSFRAFGDYPLPLNLYLTVPSIFFLGLSEFSIRFPHAILGILTIISTYFLAYGVTKKKSIGAVSAFLVAIGPWTLFSSRFVVQSNVSVFLLTTSMAFFFNREKRKYFLPTSLLLLFLTLFSYHSTRIFSPLLVIAVLIIYRHEFKKLKSKGVLNSLSFGILAAFFVALAIIFLNPQSRARSKWVFIINEGAVNRIIEMRNASNLPYGVKRLIYNRPVYFVAEFVKNYLGYFSPKYLFLDGGTQYQFSVPNHGLGYLINLPFFYLGLVLFVIKALKNKSLEAKLILFWLFLAPISAAMTTEKYAVIRSTTMIPLVEISTAAGLIFVFERFGNKLSKALLTLSYFIIVFLLLFKYLSIYFGSYSKNYSWSWQYGYKEVVDYFKANYSKYDKIILTKKYGEPHEFLLFYGGVGERAPWSWGPEDYIKDPNLVRFYQSDWYWVDSFDKFYFVNDWQIVGDESKVFVLESGGKVDCNKVNCLLVTGPDNVPLGWNIVKTVKFLNGEPAFELYEN